MFMESILLCLLFDMYSQTGEQKDIAVDGHHGGATHRQKNSLKYIYIKKTNSVALSPQAYYTD
jgi:hypothetical protein